MDRTRQSHYRSAQIDRHRKRKVVQPDAATNDALKSVAQESHTFLESSYEKAYDPPYFPSTHWALPVSPDMLKSIQSNYTIPDIYPVDARGTTYTFGFFSAKHPGAGQFYLLDIKDKDGQRLNEASTYKLTVPANAPVTQYWSATLYDAETHALIRNMSRASRSSQNPDLKKNADGSVDLYFGSKAPAGQDSNWVPTDVNGRFEVLFRLYGPERLSSTKHGCCPTSRRYSSKAHTEPHLARWTSPRKCACNG